MLDTDEIGRLIPFARARSTLIHACCHMLPPSTTRTPRRASRRRGDPANGPYPWLAKIVCPNGGGEGARIHREGYGNTQPRR